MFAKRQILELFSQKGNVLQKAMEPLDTLSRLGVEMAMGGLARMVLQGGNPQ